MHAWHREPILSNNTPVGKRLKYTGIAMYLTVTLLVIFAFLGIEMLWFVADAGPGQKVKSVEMITTADGLTTLESIGDVSANQPVRLALMNSELPEAELKGIEFTPAADVKDVSLDISITPGLTLGGLTGDSLSSAPTEIVLLFMDVSLKGDGVDFGNENAYSTRPTVTFEVDKNPDGSCKNLQLFLFDEARGEWVTEPPYMYDGQDVGSQCSYNGTVMHFSKYALGLESASGKGAVSISNDRTSPSIVSYYWKPVSLSKGQKITVDAVIIDDTFVREATLFYRDGEFELRTIPMQRPGHDWFTVDIPADALNSKTVKLWIVAVDTSGNSVTSRMATVEIP